METMHPIVLIFITFRTQLKKWSRALFVLTLMLVASTAYTQTVAKIEGLYFSHHDWEIACDNTGTCRVAGYDPMDEHSGISVLLTRAAGTNQAVIGVFSFYQDEEGIEVGGGAELPPRKIKLQIAGKDRGSVLYRNEPTSLTAQQVEALLATARTDQPIYFIDGDRGYQLSGQGMSAALLKMDEFQKRVGTPSALIRKGNSAATNLLQPQPIPVLRIPQTAQASEKLKQHYLSQKEKLAALVQKTYVSEDCSYHDKQAIEERLGTLKFEVYPLNDKQALISYACWQAAYNFGDAFWLVNQDFSTAELVTTKASSYSEGEINVNQKERGLGDCWYIEGHSWNGTRFINTSTYTTGQCRGVAGGMWALPTVVYRVERSK